MQLGLKGKSLVRDDLNLLGGGGHSVHDLGTDGPDHLGGIFGEEETLAERTTIVLSVENGRDAGEGDSSIEERIDHGVLSAGVHVLEHHLHGHGHVDVSLDCGVHLGDGARVVLELLLTGQEEASLGSTHELGVPCGSRSGEEGSGGKFHFPLFN